MLPKISREIDSRVPVHQNHRKPKNGRYDFIVPCFNIAICTFLAFIFAIDIQTELPKLIPRTDVSTCFYNNYYCDYDND